MNWKDFLLWLNTLINMKKIIILLSILSCSFSSKIVFRSIIGGGVFFSTLIKAQLSPGSMSAGHSTLDSSYTFFRFNSPTNNPGNRWEPLKVGIRETHIRTKRIYFDSIPDYPLSTIPSTANLMVMVGRQLVVAPIVSYPLSISQITTSLGYIPLENEVDGSVTNEIQNLSINEQSISISGGNTIVIPTQTTVLTSDQVTEALGYIPATNTVVSDKTVTMVSTNTVLLNVTQSYPEFTLTPYAPTTQTVTRAINGTTFQPSDSKMAWVYYTVRVNCVATIGGASSGTVSLQYSTDSGSTWIDVGQIENSNTVTLAIVLNSSTTLTGQISGVIPIGAIVRINQSSVGTTTITFIRGQETY